MHELNQLDTRSQMLLVEVVSSLTQEQLDHPDEELGRFQRNGTTYYRVRAGEFRIYFEPQDGESLYAHYILHRNTFADFAFRSKLPVTEDFLVEQHDSFGNISIRSVIKRMRPSNASRHRYVRPSAPTAVPSIR